MRIAHALTHFDLLTGSGLYVYELARIAASRGHDVVVVAEHIGGELTARAEAAGVRVRSTDAVPDVEPDILHVHQSGPGSRCLVRWPGSAVVATVHSPWPADAPLRMPRVHTYICVRPEIRQKIVAIDGVPVERTTVVLNAIDRKRFAPAAEHPRERPVVLFAATMSPLRTPAIRHLLHRSEAAGFDVILLGLGRLADVGPLPPNARWERREEWHVEHYIHACDEVAGTFLGRTAVEGWMCGKPAWVYDIVPFEGIRSVEVHGPPPPELLALFDADYVADEIDRIYSASLAERH